jgi:hypothetical protein
MWSWARAAVRLAGIRRARRRSRLEEDGGRVYGPLGLGLGGCLALGGGRRGCSVTPPCGVRLELASGKLSAGAARGRRGAATAERGQRVGALDTGETDRGQGGAAVGAHADGELGRTVVAAL